MKLRADEHEGGEWSASDDIRRIAEHQDRDAFVRLFLHYAPRCKAYLMRLGSGAEQAEDLAQETLVRLWRRAATFNPHTATASAWIFAIARNLRIDAMRRERHPSMTEQDFSFADAEPQTPAEVYESGERERQVRDAMQSLSPDQFEVLRMSFFLGQTHAQIAAQLGLPLGTVKSRLRLAMARVRNFLGEDL